tara:strand:+ start:554 stop:910 length:357 start_codon:yes stop_codon:yes gene_type:complete
MATVKLPLGLTENGTVNTPSLVTVPATGSSVTLLDGRYKYDTALVQNVGSNNICILVGGTATSSVYHIKLSPLSQADLSDASYVNVTACGDGAVTSTVVLFTIQTGDSVVTPATSYGT